MIDANSPSQAAHTPIAYFGDREQRLCRSDGNQLLVNEMGHLSRRPSKNSFQSLATQEVKQLK